MATPIPANSAAFVLSELVQVTGARLLGNGNCAVRGVTTDSRSDVAGKLYVALPGERFDGHSFLQQAVAGGANAVLVDRDQLPELPVPILKVGSTSQALLDIAKCHRNRWRGRLMAIAGSAGKTTTRVACQSLLETIYPSKVHATPGNLNNQVGVPMTLLGLTESHDYAVVEVGTNFPGEVGKLAEVCRPDVAILTLVGLEHTEGLGDIDSIEEEEGDIFGVLATAGVAVGNGDDPRVKRQLARKAANSRQVLYGVEPGVDYQVAHHASQLDRVSVVVERSQRLGGGRLNLESKLLGRPGAMAVAAAIAASESLGMSVEQSHAMSAWLGDDIGEAGRLQVLELDQRIVVLDDCYNANPPSMASSIAVATELAESHGSRLLLVLGEMRELGSQSEREHRILGKNLGKVSLLIAVGEQAAPLFESASACGVPSEYCENSNDAAERIAQLTRAGDVVLVKGSRGVRLEIVVRTLAAKKGRAA
jgi:UDP-N-acetylmuramoyl-tripeptide--D-alanyl-D-alanine ligase